MLSRSGSLGDLRDVLCELRRVGLDDLRAQGVSEQLLTQQADAFVSSVEQRFPDAEATVLDVGGRHIGSMIVGREDSDLHLIDLGIVPEFRRRGYGSSLIIGLQQRAARDECSLTLRVAETNAAALDLYERLGFVDRPASSTPTDRFMAWTPTTEVD